ncbi:MAG: tyrosine-type recombinase/integrase [Rubrivivax sp.]
MKLALNQSIVDTMSLAKIPVPGKKPLEYREPPPPKAAGAASGSKTEKGLANYLVYDTHNDAPPGFAVRVGKKASVYLVDKLVKGRKLKIPVGLAAGRKGSEKPLPLAQARERAWEQLQIAKKHGANPKDIQEQIEAAELSMGQIWDRYIDHLRNRQVRPAKQNSLDSVDKARKKLADWDHRTVGLITGQEIIDRFNLHAVEKKHRTAAEAMGRWATAAVKHSIEREVHDAHAAQRAPTLTYNPFTILQTEELYRDSQALEREYAKKGIRNPMTSDQLGKFIQAAWDYRRENPVAADFLLIDLLFGMRAGECCTFKWKEHCSPAELVEGRWIDLDNRAAFVGDAKNRGDHLFPIGPCAAELLSLRRAAQMEGQAWVFPAASPKSEKGHYSDPSVARDTVRERAGVKVLRGHDLRRTFGRVCEELGFTPAQTQRLLGHATAGGKATHRYTDPEWKVVAKRMERVERKILSPASRVYDALKPLGRAPIGGDEAESFEIPIAPARKSRRTPR